MTDELRAEVERLRAVAEAARAAVRWQRGTLHDPGRWVVVDDADAVAALGAALDELTP